MPNEFLATGRLDFINKTFNWTSSDTEEEYLNAIKTKEIPYGPGDITYRYNNYGFRCDDFFDYHTTPYRVLFAGCSMTEGIGVALDDLWAKQMHRMICDKLGVQIPYWNVATAGAGLDHLVRYLYNLKDLLRPQIVISYLPSNVRRERWNGDHWSVWEASEGEQLFWKWPIKVDKKVETFMNERYIEYQTEKNFAMLDMILNELDCMFLYSSSMENFSISNYIHSPRYIQRDHVPEQYDFGRDGIHAGPKTNTIMAERAFEFFWPTIEQRLTITK